MKLISWNVNGIRAVVKKGMLDWLCDDPPDVFCFQELKAQAGQLDVDSLIPPTHHGFWNWGDRKGYSGVSAVAARQPEEVRFGLGVDRFDAEGRVIQLRYPEFTLLNVYFPNGQSSAERLQFKLDFYDAFFDYTEGLRARGERIVCCGDYNTAHHEIDLARPKANERISGFLPVERAWMDKFEGHGYVDTFRMFNQDPGQYTYWDMKSRARDRNVGWRIDYFYVSEELKPHVSGADILPGVMGSDHCPTVLELTL